MTRTDTMKNKLTTAQRVLLYVTECHAAGAGSPSVREIAAWVGHSTSVVHRALERLEDAGYIRRQAGRSRTVVLLKPGAVLFESVCLSRGEAQRGSK